MQPNPVAIGRYQVVAELGQGAMGIVFLAQDPLLKRKVAIKVMKERAGEHSNVMERFRREAETSSRLNHPNVITVYDVGEDPEMGPFLAMEYVEGTSLAALIQREALSREAAYQTLLQVMQGLQAAGKEGVIHRDVKPENILVGKDGRVKLMDFGIARGEGARLTTTGMVVGTPSYTAPELLLGKEASAETDLYAFSVTAFELLTGGQLPYTGDSLGVTLYRIVHEPPVMPMDMEPELARVFIKALDKDPAHRFQGLGEFMTSLAGVLGLPPPSHPGGVVHAVSHPAALGARPSQDDLHTAAVPAAVRDRPTVKAGGTPVPSEAGKQLQAPPEELLHPRSSGAKTPAQARPGPPPAPPPLVVVKPSSGSKAQKARVERDLSEWVKIFVLVGVLVAGGFKGWEMYSKAQERTLQVNTNVPESEVLIDEVPVGRTDARGTWTGIVKSGARKLTVSGYGYSTVEQPLKPADTSVRVERVLNPGFIRIESLPSHAKVYIDGEPSRETPLYAKEIGDKTINLKLTPSDAHVGYLPWEGKVSAAHPPPKVIRLPQKGH